MNVFRNEDPSVSSYSFESSLKFGAGNGYYSVRISGRHKKAPPVFAGWAC